MSAASHGHGEIAAALLAAGADFDARDEEGRTALMHAREHHHQDVALLLQEAGGKG
jgi:ankyrin repeat protein